MSGRACEGGRRGYDDTCVRIETAVCISCVLL